MAMVEPIHERSVYQLLGAAVEQLGKLVQNEMQLARAELTEKAVEAGTGAAYLAVAGLFAIPVLVMLLFALAIWFTQLGLSPALSYVASAVVGAIVGGAFAATGMSHLKPKNLKPTVTIEQLGRDAAAAKGLK